MRVGVLYSRVRKDEKLLLEELRERDHDVVKLDTRSLKFGLEGETGSEDAFDESESDAMRIADLDVVVDRAMSYSRGLYAVKFAERYGVPAVNPYDVARVCGNKVDTSTALDRAGVATPDTRVAFTVDSALDAVEELGYPVVVKPVVGSWARLLAKVNDREAAEAVLEHKDVLGHYEHSVFYLQDYVEKPDRDIRVMVAGDEVVAAMYRSSEDWITNAAHGAETTDCEVTPEIAKTALDAAEAVGGGVLGVDIMETPEGTLTVHEVNHTLEFKALTDATGVDVAAAFVDHVERRAAA
jgi:[lysine-biosynthesis-protein LysW]--L-2-aminoadipate ligase